MSDIKTKFERRVSGEYEVGLCILGEWRWKQLATYQRRMAEKKAPEALAELLYDASGSCAKAAADFAARAKALRLLGERAMRGENVNGESLPSTTKATGERDGE